MIWKFFRKKISSSDCLELCSYQIMDKDVNFVAGGFASRRCVRLMYSGDPETWGIRTLSVITTIGVGRRRHLGAMDAAISLRSSTVHRQYKASGFVYLLLVINLLVAVVSSAPSGADVGPLSAPDGDKTVQKTTNYLGGIQENALPLSYPQGVRNTDESPDNAAKASAQYSGHQTGLVPDQELLAVRTSRTNNDIVPNEIPVNPNRYQDVLARHQAAYTNAEAMASRFGDQKIAAAPKYMVELYNKFSLDKYVHPVTNIVRSYMNINEGKTMRIFIISNYSFFVRVGT